MRAGSRSALKWGPFALAALAVSALAGGSFGEASAARTPAGPVRSPAARPAAPAFAHGSLTPQGADRYEYRSSADGLRVTAPRSNRGGNLRAVWWSAPGKPSVDQQACVTWTDFDGPLVQAGVALRVRRTGGHVEAVTVTNNVWSGARSGWNVHVWRGDLASSGLVGQVFLPAFGTSVFQPPLPWRMCARAIGRLFEFKAWAMAVDPEPEWGDPTHGASMVLTADTVAAGRAGWYVGHLRGGETTEFDAMHAGRFAPTAGARLAIATRAAGGCVARTQTATAGLSPWRLAAGCGQVTGPPTA